MIMEFTKEEFLKFWKQVIPVGMTLDLSVYDAFIYFEFRPYEKESIIKYNSELLSNDYSDGIELTCSTRIGNFDIGESIVHERLFMRYAKEIRLHGNYPEEWKKVLTEIKSRNK